MIKKAHHLKGVVQYFFFFLNPLQRPYRQINKTVPLKLPPLWCSMVTSYPSFTMGENSRTKVQTSLGAYPEILNLKMISIIHMTLRCSQRPVIWILHHMNNGWGGEHWSNRGGFRGEDFLFAFFFSLA